MEMQQKIDRFVKIFERNYVITEGGRIRDIRKNRYYIPSDVWQKYDDMMLYDAPEDTLSKKEVEEIINNLIAEKKEPEPKKVDLMQYIIKTLKDSRRFMINRSFTEIRSMKPGSDSPLNSDINDIKHFLLAKATSDPVLGEFKTGQIENTLYDLARQAKENSFAKLVEDLEYDEDCVPFLDTYLHKIHEHFKIQEDYEIFKMMMCHWAWQVKRRLKMKPVVWHIWLNFYGPTGTGKSWFINALAKSFDEFYGEGAKISFLFDSTKEIKKMTEKYIIYFDELAVNNTQAVAGVEAISTDDIKTLKSILTGNKLDTRIYGTQEQMKRTITFSCISSANDHLYDVIFDPETMRRYFEFNCMRTEVGNDDEQKSLNAILDRSVEFWRAIDDNRETGYWNPNSDLGKKVWSIQKNYYPTKSTLIEMHKYYDFNREMQNDTCESYRIYADWCKQAGMKPKSIMNFNTEVAKRWPELLGPDGLPHINFVPKNGSQNAMSDFCERMTENKAITVGDGLPAPDVDDFEAKINSWGD
jgi:hypothetical protein